MLKLIGTLARVAFGFALASIAAGLVTVLFVNTPADVLAGSLSRLPQTASEIFDLALLTATHAAIFASVFVLITAGVGESFSIRSLPFYLIAGMAIAALGFTAQYASEVSGQPTIFNNYAMKAFLTAGFFAGFVYWLAAGQFAGKPPVDAAPGDDGVTFRPHRDEPPEEASPPESPEEPQTVTITRTKAAPEDGKTDADDSDPDKEVIINRPDDDEPKKPRYAALLQRWRRPKQPSPTSEMEADPLADEAHYRADDDDDAAVIVRRPAATTGGRKPGGDDA